VASVVILGARHVPVTAAWALATPLALSVVFEVAFSLRIPGGRPEAWLLERAVVVRSATGKAGGRGVPAASPAVGQSVAATHDGPSRKMARPVVPLIAIVSRTSRPRRASEETCRS
jgi:hypothetical protein